MKDFEAQGQAAFKEYVTATAFQITLNKNQVHLLYFLYRYGYKHGDAQWTRHRDKVNDGRRADFVQTVRALIRRGLVVHNWVESNAMREKDPTWKESEHQYYLVTTAGKLVAKMLIHSGIVQDIREEKQNV